MLYVVTGSVMMMTVNMQEATLSAAIARARKLVAMGGKDVCINCEPFKG